jgi:Fic family protein
MVRRDAVLSSRIEGTVATLSDLVRYEVAPAAVQATDVAEVYNYVAAVEHVLAPDRRLPLSLSLLREAHEILLTGVRGGYATPGEFRRTQNWIGSPGCVLDTATYVPPPPERMWECLDAFEKHLHAEHELPPLVTIACLHYQFEAIHPFIDGNGRVGRLLVALLLVDWGLLPAALLDLSAYLEPRRDEYYARLLAVTIDGDWVGWISFFLDVVANQASDALRRAQELQSLRDELRGRVTGLRSSSLAPRLVDALFETPAMTIGRAAKVLDVTRRAATQNVERLLAAGVLIEVASTGRARLFVAEDVLRVLSSEG